MNHENPSTHGALTALFYVVPQVLPSVDNINNLSKNTDFLSLNTKRMPHYKLQLMSIGEDTALFFINCYLFTVDNPVYCSTDLKKIKRQFVGGIRPCSNKVEFGRLPESLLLMYTLNN